VRRPGGEEREGGLARPLTQFIWLDAFDFDLANLRWALVKPLLAAAVLVSVVGRFVFIADDDVTIAHCRTRRHEPTSLVAADNINTTSFFDAFQNVW